MYRKPTISWVVPLFALIFLCLFSCGRDDEKPVVASSAPLSNENEKDIPCNKSNKCPTITLVVKAEPDLGGQLRGVVNQAGTWTFRGSADGGGSRDIRVQGSNPPSIGNFNQVDNLTVNINYKALQATIGPQPIVVSIRDVSLCKFLHEGKESACENLGDGASFANLNQFQKEMSFTWSIGQDLSASQQSSSGPLKDCSKGAATGAAGSASSGGGFWGTIIAGAVGCASGVFGG